MKRIALVSFHRPRLCEPYGHRNGRADRSALQCLSVPNRRHIDPALNSAVDGAIYIGHLFEGIYTYAPDGIPRPWRCKERTRIRRRQEPGQLS